MKKGILSNFKGAVRMLTAVLILSAFYPLHAAKYYWVGGSGNWRDLSHWASASGGTEKYLTLPGTYDDVIFDANSGFAAANNTVTLDSTGHCYTMNWTGATNTPIFTDGSNNYQLYVYGSLTLSAGMTFDINSLYFKDNDDFYYWGYYNSSEMNRTLTANGVILNSNIIFDVDNDYIDLIGSINNNNNIVILQDGTYLLAVGDTITCGTFIINDSPSLDLRNGAIISSTFQNNGNFPNLELAGSHISVVSSFIASNGGGFVNYHNVTLNGVPSNPAMNVTLDLTNSSYHNLVVTPGSTWTGNLTINNNGFGNVSADVLNLILTNAANNVFNNADFTVNKSAILDGVFFLNNGSIDAEDADSLTLTAGTVVNISPAQSLSTSRLMTLGTAADTVRISSTSAGNQTDVTVLAGSYCLDFVKFTDVDFSGGNADLNAPTGCNGGNNTGITFAASCGVTPEAFSCNNPSSLSICYGSPVTISYNYSGATLTGANVFGLWISDENGNWTNNNVANVTSATPVPFVVTIPNLGTSGTNYRFWVSASEIPGNGYSAPNPSPVSIGGVPNQTWSTGNYFSLQPGEVFEFGYDIDGLAPWDYTFTDGSSIQTITNQSNPSVFTYQTQTTDHEYQFLSISNVCGVGNTSGSTRTINMAGDQDENPSVMFFGDTTICRTYNGGSDFLEIKSMISNTVNPDDYIVYYERSDDPGDVYTASHNDYLRLISQFPNTASVGYKPLFLQNTNSGANYTNVSGFVKATVNARPEATLSLANGANSTICQNSSTTLEIDFTEGNAPWTVNYDAGGSVLTITGITTNPYQFTVAPQTSTQYALNTSIASVVSGTCSSESGSLSGSQFINVQEPASATVSSHDTTLYYCSATNSGSPYAIVVDIQGGNAPYSITYTAGSNSFNYGGLGTGVNTINLYPNVTTTYTVTGVNSGGVCVGGYVNAAPVVVTVNSISGLSATVTGAGNICSGSAINLSVNINGSFPVNFVYSDGVNQYTVNGVTSTPFVWTVNPTTSTTYALQSISNLCNNNSANASAVITVNNAVTTAGFNVMPMGGMDYHFMNTSANAVSYTWNFGDGTTFTTTTADTMHTYMAPGIYQVSLTATGACGSQTSVQTITVAMTGTASSLDQVLAQVYPNPSNGQVFIELTGTTSTFDMTVENLQGQVITEGQIVGGNRAEINLETTPGVYIVRLQNGEQTLVRKLVIQ